MMISGGLSKRQTLNGSIVAEETLQGSISSNKTLTGKVSVSVRDVPYYETSNISGGTTIYIGKEVPINGNK